MDYLDSGLCCNIYYLHWCRVLYAWGINLLILSVWMLERAWKVFRITLLFFFAETFLYDTKIRISFNTRNTFQVAGWTYILPRKAKGFGIWLFSVCDVKLARTFCMTWMYIVNGGMLVHIPWISFLKQKHMCSCDMLSHMGSQKMLY